MQFETVANFTPDHQPGRQSGPRHKPRSQSPQRILAQRLRLNGCKPRAWAVAQLLAAYSRQSNDGTTHIATLYHDKIAAETGLSVATVRLAVRELTEGPAPLYIKRGTSGQQRTVRAKNFTLTTSAVVYEWIADLPAFLAARDTARAANLLEFEGRQREVHADKVRLQGQHMTGQIDAATATAEIAKLDRKARGKLPRKALQDKPYARCLTQKQVRQYAVEIIEQREYGELVKDDVNHREVYALRKHVLDMECRHCQLAVVNEWKRAGNNPDMLRDMEAEIGPCGCGVLVVRTADHAADFWEWISKSVRDMHNCSHEQTRQLQQKTAAARSQPPPSW